MNSFTASLPILLIFQVIFTSCGMFEEAMSMCCPDTEEIIFYPAAGKNCFAIEGAYNWEDKLNNQTGLCSFETCADLQNHEDRYFCGKGDCNFLGCNCDGGCIQLEEAELNTVRQWENLGKKVYLRDIFLEKHKDKIDRLYLGELRGFNGEHIYQYSHRVSSQTPIERL